MPYMQSRGDYLGGGYQRGDPGLFGFLGGIAQKVAGAAFRASPVGRIIEAVRGPQIPVSRIQERLPSPGGVGGPAGMGRLPVPIPTTRGAIERILPYGKTGYECPPTMRGYHLAKDGSGRMVKNRTMNVANPRALRRAIRREQGFVKLAQRSLKGTGYKIARR